VKGAAVILFSLSAVFFYGAIRFFFHFLKRGVYPPKQILKKRIAVFSGGGLLLLLTGWLIYVL
jgi:EamA domain-containing membrane protein RarD